VKAKTGAPSHRGDHSLSRFDPARKNVENVIHDILVENKHN